MQIRIYNNKWRLSRSRKDVQGTTSRPSGIAPNLNQNEAAGVLGINKDLRKRCINRQNIFWFLGLYSCRKYLIFYNAVYRYTRYTLRVAIFYSILMGAGT